MKLDQNYSVLFVLGTFTFLIQQSEGASTIIPFYLYPQVVNGVHNWSPLITANDKYDIEVWAIVNPSNGPGTSLDQNYASSIQMLKTAGINTLGYVRTNYGAQSQSAVRADIQLWKSYYSPDGIFFDEMAYQDNSTLVNYYRSISRYAKNQGFDFTVGNPGTDTIPAYTRTVDTIVIYEKGGSFPTKSNYGGWHDRYPKTKWAIIPYGIQALNSTQVRDAKRHVEYIYVTNDTLPNPWDSVPPYLNQLFKLLES